MQGVYLYFFHGRLDETEQLEDWGKQGPVIGPVAISWTYGGIKIHNLAEGTWGEDWENLPTNKDGDLIKLGDVHYGDFEVWSADDKLVEEHRFKNNIVDYNGYLKLIGKTPKI